LDWVEKQYGTKLRRKMQEFKMNSMGQMIAELDREKAVGVWLFVVFTVNYARLSISIPRKRWSEPI